MRVGIHQPMYLPWPGLFDRIYECDVFVLLDNVPYSKNYLINRNKIKTVNGWMWLTVPVLTKGCFGQLIKDVQINNATQWRKQHWKSIYYSYIKAPYFSNYAEFFEQVYKREWLYLIEIIEELFAYILKAQRINTTIIKASDLNIGGIKEDFLLNICKTLKADEYLSGPDGKNYLNPELWRENNINVIYHSYHQPEYPQLHGQFLPQMSIIDLLFNCGDESLKILSQNELDENDL